MGSLMRRGNSSTGAHELAQGLGWFSIALGTLELAAPGMLARALGMEGREALLRAYGLREVATGIAILNARDPAPWLWGRVGGDALDVATLVAHYTDDNPRKDVVGLAIAAVAGVTALDVYCAAALSGDDFADEIEDFYDYGDRSGMPLAPEEMRGAASDFEVPRDFRTPEALRPWKV